MLLSDASPFSPVRFAVPLLEWHLHHGRQLPWMTKQPYDVWLSEVMLQQTQVSTVLERFAAFKKQFPTIDDLAAAAVEDVLAQWSGLGYYRRARNLHACAQALAAWIAEHGNWPQEAHQWVALPGIGRSTANAIVSACFDKVEPILDANAKRVLLRFAGDLDATDKVAWTYAEQAMFVSTSQAAAYTQAIMDLGATVCTARKAECLRCPLMTQCKSAGWETVKPAKGVEGAHAATKNSKSEKPVVSFDWALCLRENSEVLLVLRDESSFWPALWVFPDMSARFSTVPGVDEYNIKHELSHRSLCIRIQNVALTGGQEPAEKWVALADIRDRKIPVPSPVAALLKNV